MMKKAQAATTRRFTPRATLAALGIKLRSMKLLEPIQMNVEVPQTAADRLSAAHPESAGRRVACRRLD